MPSNFITGQYFEWCTLLPSKTNPCKSPIFLFWDIKWVFRLELEDNTQVTVYRLYFDAVVLQRIKFKPFLVQFQIGFENEKLPILWQGELRVSKRRTVCTFPAGKIKSSLSHGFIEGTKLKFLFCFKILKEPLLFIKKETEKEAERATECHSFQDCQKSSDSKEAHLMALSNDFSKLLDKSTDYDVEIKCEGETFQAHRNILGARSDIFEAIFKSNMTDGKICTIEVDDMKASVFQMFLRYLYTGMLPDLNVDTAKQLYEAGDAYMVKEFKKLCLVFLVKNLSYENAHDMLALANKHNDPDFRKTVISFIIDNAIC